MTVMNKRRTSTDKIVVSESAIIRRINRILKKLPLKGCKKCKLLKTHTRDVEKVDRFGSFYIVGDNDVAKVHVNLEAFAREYGALAPWEALAS